MFDINVLQVCVYFVLIMVCVCVCRGRLLVGTFVALFFNLLTLLSVKNKPFVYVSEGRSTLTVLTRHYLVCRRL